MHAIVVAVLAVVAAVWTHQEDGPRMFRGELRARLRAIGVQYTNPTSVGQGVILRGEPLEVDLVLSSEGNARTGAEEDWPSRVMIELGAGVFSSSRPVVRERVRCSILAQRGMRVNDEVGGIELRGREAAEVRCRLGEVLATRPAGPYHIVVSWSDAIDRRTFADRSDRKLRDLVEFELRDVSSALDGAERDYHLAHRAVFHDGRPSIAAALMDRRLAGEPQDIVALTMRAHARRALGDCQAAVADARAAEGLLSEGTRDAARGVRRDPRESVRWIVDELSKDPRCRPK